MLLYDNHDKILHAFCVKCARRTEGVLGEDGIRRQGPDGDALLRGGAARRGGQAPAQVRGQYQRQAGWTLPIQVHREFCVVGTSRFAVVVIVCCCKMGVDGGFGAGVVLSSLVRKVPDLSIRT